MSSVPEGDADSTLHPPGGDASVGSAPDEMDFYVSPNPGLPLDTTQNSPTPLCEPPPTDSLCAPSLTNGPMSAVVGSQAITCQSGGSDPPASDSAAASLINPAPLPSMDVEPAAPPSVDPALAVVGALPPGLPNHSVPPSPLPSTPIPTSCVSSPSPHLSPVIAAPSDQPIVSTNLPPMSVAAVDHPLRAPVNPTTTPACLPSSGDSTPITTLAPYEPRRSGHQKKSKKFTPVSQRTMEELFRTPSWPRFFLVTGSPVDDCGLYDVLSRAVGDFSMHSVGNSRRIIEASSEEQSLAIQEYFETSEGDRYTGREDEHLNQCVGTMVLPRDFEFSDQDFGDSRDRILALLQRSDPTVVKVDTFTTRPRGSRPPLRIVKIFFKCHNLPPFVRLAGRQLSVRQYTVRPRQCTHCWKLGHSTIKCFESPRCRVCGFDTHTLDACDAPAPRCANCDGPHEANDKTCPHFAYHQEIQHIRTTTRVSFGEAAGKVRQAGRAPPFRRSNSAPLTARSGVRSSYATTASTPSTAAPPPRMSSDFAFRHSYLSSPALSLHNRFEGFAAMGDTELQSASDVDDIPLGVRVRNYSTPLRSARPALTPRRKRPSGRSSTSHTTKFTRTHADQENQRWVLSNHSHDCGCHRCGRSLLLRLKTSTPAEVTGRLSAYMRLNVATDDLSTHPNPCYCAAHLSRTEMAPNDIVKQFLKDNNLTDSDVTNYALSPSTFDIHFSPGATGGEAFPSPRPSAQDGMPPMPPSRPPPPAGPILHGPHGAPPHLPDSVLQAHRSRTEPCVTNLPPQKCGCHSCFHSFIAKHSHGTDALLLAKTQEFSASRILPTTTSPSSSVAHNFLGHLQQSLLHNPSFVPDLAKQFSALTVALDRSLSIQSTVPPSATPGLPPRAPTPISPVTDTQGPIHDSQDSTTIDDPSPQSPHHAV